MKSLKEYNDTMAQSSKAAEILCDFKTLRLYIYCLVILLRLTVSAVQSGRG